MTDYDTIIIGGGPGGLSASLIMGRSNRKTLLIDGGERRNISAEHMHSFVSRDGCPPSQFREESLKQLDHYPSITTLSHTLVTSIQRLTSAKPHLFQVTVKSEKDQGEKTQIFQSKFVILAMGVHDDLDDTGVKNLKQGWGDSVFACPYCHGYENKGGQWGVLINHPLLFEVGLVTLSWSSNITFFLNYPNIPESPMQPPPHLKDFFQRGQIKLEERKIVSVEYEGQGSKKIKKAILEDGTEVPLTSMIIKPKQTIPDVAKSLGLDLDPLGYVKVDPMTKQTSMEGLYAIGDITTLRQQALFSATDGVYAATSVNRELVLASLPN